MSKCAAHTVASGTVPRRTPALRETFGESRRPGVLARTTAPAILWGVPLSKSDVRTRYKITVVGIKREGEKYTYAESDTIAHRGDELIISGSVKAVEKFSSLPHDVPEDIQ